MNITSLDGAVSSSTSVLVDTFFQQSEHRVQIIFICKLSVRSRYVVLFENRILQQGKQLASVMTVIMPIITN